jgi:hypothetical protein
MINILNEYPLMSGISMIIIGIIWLLYRFRKTESYMMKDHGLASWKEMVNTWGVIVFLLVWGVILILRAI